MTWPLQGKCNPRKIKENRQVKMWKIWLTISILARSTYFENKRFFHLLLNICFSWKIRVWRIGWMFAFNISNESLFLKPLFILLERNNALKIFFVKTHRAPSNVLDTSMSAKFPRISTDFQSVRSRQIWIKSFGIKIEIYSLGLC